MKYISLDLIKHGLSGRLAPVSDAHAILRNENRIYTEKEKNDAIETIVATKSVFEIFLDDIIKNRSHLLLPKEFGIGKIEKIREKEDFNWLDYDAYVVFLDWYTSYIKAG